MEREEEGEDERVVRVLAEPCTVPFPAVTIPSSKLVTYPTSPQPPHPCLTSPPPPSPRTGTPPSNRVGGEAGSGRGRDGWRERKGGRRKWRGASNALTDQGRVRMEKLAGSWRVAWWREGRSAWYLPTPPSLPPSSASVHVHETPP